MQGEPSVPGSEPTEALCQRLGPSGREKERPSVCTVNPVDTCPPQGFPASFLFLTHCLPLVSLCIFIRYYEHKVRGTQLSSNVGCAPCGPWELEQVSELSLLVGAVR